MPSGGRSVIKRITLGLLLALLPPDPANALITVGALDTRQANDVEVVGSLAYVADDFAGLRVIDFGPEYAPVRSIEVDIKPGNDLNPVNPMSRGVIPVGSYGSDTFDVADVDVSTLAFAPAGAPLARENGAHAKDADHDGFDDLLAHFPTEEAGIAFGDTEACVAGELLDGTPIEGCDDIVTERPVASDSNWCSCCRR